MSKVTGFVLICSAIDGSPALSIGRINEWLAQHRFASISDVADTNFVGGKHPEISVYVAGFNYFPDDEFVEFFQTLRWYMPDRCVLVLTPQECTARIIRSETEPLEI